MNLSTNTRLAIPIVAAAYSDRFGIKISVSGSEAYATTNSINLPIITKDFDKKLLWGYLAHEAGHIRFTNFDVCTGLNGLRHTLWNIIEDIWIENCMIREYLGTAVTMDAILEYNVKLGSIKAPTEDCDPKLVLLSYILIAGRFLYRKQDALSALYQQTRQVILKRFLQRNVIEIDRILSKVKEAASTQDCLAIADEILDFLGERQEAYASQGHTDSQGSGQQGSDDSGDAGDQGNGQQGSDDSGDAGGQGSGQQGSDDSGDAGGQGSGQQGSNDSGDAGGVGEHRGGSKNQSVKNFLDGVLSDMADGAHSFDLTDAVRQALSNSGGATNGDQEDIPPYLPAVRPSYWHTTQGADLVERVHSESHAIRTRLHGLIQANTLVRDRLHRSGKRLATNRIARLATGNTKVFEHRSEKQLPNADIHIIVDLSGSMSRNVDSRQYSRLAVEAAVALAEALQTVKGISVTMTAFGPERNHPISLIAEGEKVRQCASRFVTTPGGGTPMSHALLHAGVSVLSRKKQRKIVFAMTDGDPDNITQTMKTISLLEDEGVEIYGIGIDHDVSHLFKRSVVISDLSELKTELFRVARDALINN